MPAKATKRKRYRFPDRESAERAEEEARYHLTVMERMLSRVIESIHCSYARIRTYRTPVIPPRNIFYAVRALPEGSDGNQWYAVTFFCAGQSPTTTLYDRQGVEEYIRKLSLGTLDTECCALRDALAESLTANFDRAPLRSSLAV